MSTALETSVFLFEVPIGVVADSYSRRTSVIVGIFLVGISFIVNGLFPVFWIIALAQVIWGLGCTFTSGAHQACINDELGEEEASLAFVRGSTMDQGGRFHSGSLDGDSKIRNHDWIDSCIISHDDRSRHLGCDAGSNSAAAGKSAQ